MAKTVFDVLKQNSTKIFRLQLNFFLGGLLKTSRAIKKLLA